MGKGTKSVILFVVVAIALSRFNAWNADRLSEEKKLTIEKKTTTTIIPKITPIQESVLEKMEQGNGHELE